MDRLRNYYKVNTIKSIKDTKAISPNLVDWDTNSEKYYCGYIRENNHGIRVMTSVLTLNYFFPLMCLWEVPRLYETAKCIFNNISNDSF